MAFSGRTVIVTGGTGALGVVAVRRFAALGANIAIPLHSAQENSSLAERFKLEEQRLATRTTDLTNEQEVQGFVQEVMRRFGRVDVLINAAGGYAGGTMIEETPPDEVQRLFRLNTLSAFNMCSAVLPEMKKARYGRIINIASMTAVHVQPNAGAYTISKRAVITLTEAIAAETRGKGITANAVAPGTILTEANKAAMPSSDQSKWVTPDQVVDVLLFLASGESGVVSGSLIKIP
jgi:NAD(P)-dependent dehydrogenase (short-subunit alcohol dehydrogenase family)